MLFRKGMRLSRALAAVFQRILVRGQRLGNLIFLSLQHQRPSIEQRPLGRGVKG